MKSEQRNWKSRALIAAMLSASVATVGFTRLYAEDPKPAQPSEQKPADAKPAEAKPAEAKPAQPQQPAQADPHAGHNHGPVGPQIPGAKPGADVPTPTVVLKPGEVPAIKFDTPIYDFGKVRSGADIKHDFYFTNTGTGPLEILRVKPSCGCTVAGAHDRVVQPNQTGKIPITLSSKNASGPMSKTITVNTNVAGTDATVTLQIKGEVWQPIQVTPQAAAFGRITSQDAGAKLLRKLTIVNNLESPVKLGEPTSNNPKIKGEITTLEEGKKFELTVTLVPPLDSGNTSGRLTIPTGVSDVPSLEVQAYAFVTAAVDVTPNTMILPPTRTAAITRQFYIRSNVNKAVKITDLQSTNPEIKLELTDVKDAMTFRLKVDVPASYTPTPGGDKITFKTDNPDVPQITIPINTQPVPASNPLVNIGQKRVPESTTGGPVVIQQGPPAGATPAKTDANPGATTDTKKEGGTPSAKE